MTARIAGSPTTKTPVAIAELPRITTHASATADSTNDIFAKRSRTDTTSTVITRATSGNRTRRGRNWDGYGNFGGSPELRQTALNAGYNEGNKQGRKDRNKRNNNSFQSQSAYQKATQDYNSRLGDRGLYQRYFREAYENGFSDGVNGY